MNTTSDTTLLNGVLAEDMAAIFESLSSEEKEKLRGATILITGCGGFLGYSFMHFLSRFAHELGLSQVIGLENFLTGSRDWLESLVAKDENRFKLHKFNVISDSVSDVPGADQADFVIHLASVASPTFYRKFPLETLDANITGLRRLLEFYARRPDSLKGLLFFSSSEVYGNPLPEYIPTPEDYHGNVATIGPRACYDESKRVGETLCYLFARKYQMPVGVVRPFNNYGPGMSIHDRRLPADFAKAVVEGHDLEIFSDGRPTRTFCYVSDAISGYLKTLLFGRFEVFNIGMDEPEISVREFAECFVKHGRDLFGYEGEVSFQPPDDQEYLTDNPDRRCPNIAKARELLGYRPAVRVDEGVGRFLAFLQSTKGGLA